MKPRLHVAIVTGLSGSGKSTAIHALEDLGYYCIDNLPAALIPRFIELCERSEEMSRAALGVDSRGREFLDELPRALEEVRKSGHRVEVIFLDASDDALVRRFSETRRPHPLSAGSDVAAAIGRERERLAWLREHADRILDTSAYTGHELRAAVHALFSGTEGEHRLRVALVSFGFKYGLPADADVVWDVRFLPNPFYVDDLRPKTGRDQPVAEYVLENPLAQRFLEIAGDYLSFSLPHYEHEGKSYLTIAVGCTGGRHRSVVLVESLARMLQGAQAQVSVRHRDVDR
ncbi:MAG: RNase adapter RapZ [Deltaproteobacteria bacterium]|nr:RNase adapter RapZ [Deltaproteobacteria bacterium]